MNLEFSVKCVLGLDIYPIYVLCNKTFLGEMQHTHLLTSNREPMTNQGTDITKFQHGEPVSFVGVTYVSVGEGFLTGAEMVHRQLHHNSPPQHWRQLTQSGNLEHSTKPIGGSSGWRRSYPRPSVLSFLFQAAQLVSSSSRQNGLA